MHPPARCYNPHDEGITDNRHDGYSAVEYGKKDDHACRHLVESYEKKRRCYCSIFDFNLDKNFAPIAAIPKSHSFSKN